MIPGAGQQMGESFLQSIFLKLCPAFFCKFDPEFCWINFRPKRIRKIKESLKIDLHLKQSPKWHPHFPLCFEPGGWRHTVDAEQLRVWPSQTVKP